MPRNLKSGKSSGRKRTGHRSIPAPSSTPVEPPVLPLLWCHLNILGAEFTVLLSDEHKSPTMKDCEGFCDFKTSTIYVDAALEDNRKRDVLTHEILHAVIYMAGMDKMFEQLFGESKITWDDREEILVSTFGVNLHDTLVRNGLLKFPEIPPEVSVFTKKPQAI